MDFNHIYRVNEDGSVIISFSMEHVIVKGMIEALRTKELLLNYKLSQ